jgi:thiol-disulfide isomerase/thioredoxin
MKDLLVVTALSILLNECSVLISNGNNIGRPGQANSPNQVKEVELNPLGTTPELTGSIGLNTEIPLQISELKRKVILIDFCTLGCINCQRVIPSVRAWYETYGGRGLVVIGDQYPEFGYEKDLSHLKDALNRLNVPFPVVQDNDGKNWEAYDIHYWPTLILIDKNGQIRYKHVGEGRYDEIENTIQILLNEEVVEE